MRTLLFRVFAVIAVLLGQGFTMLIAWLTWRWRTGRLHSPAARPVPQHDLIEPVGISVQDR